MDQNQLKDLLYRADAVRSGHFLRASGRHSNLYIQCAHLFENARSAQEVCALIAQHYAKSGVQLVLSAAIGGMLAGLRGELSAGRAQYVCRAPRPGAYPAARLCLCSWHAGADCGGYGIHRPQRAGAD